jgi:hypothetical protein
MSLYNCFYYHAIDDILSIESRSSQILLYCIRFKIDRPIIMSQESSAVLHPSLSQNEPA